MPFHIVVTRRPCSKSCGINAAQTGCVLFKSGRQTLGDPNLLRNAVDKRTMSLHMLPANARSWTGWSRSQMSLGGRLKRGDVVTIAGGGGDYGSKPRLATIVQ